VLIETNPSRGDADRGYSLSAADLKTEKTGAGPKSHGSVRNGGKWRLTLSSELTKETRELRGRGVVTLGSVRRAV